MRWRDRTVASAILLLLISYSLGFLIHRSTSLAGSAWGGLLGVMAALLMTASLMYSLAKRVPGFREADARRWSVRALLGAHVYLGLLGALLALLHTGHKFGSVLGIVLTAVMLLTVVSGFTGQYYLRYVADDVRAIEADLGILRRALEAKTRALSRTPVEVGETLRASAELASVAAATAELQYSLQFQARVRRQCGRWRVVHVACSAIFYALLLLHVWAGIYFGLRWFR